MTHKTVPIKATHDMLLAAVSWREVDADDEIPELLQVYDRVYHAMLSAAPPDNTVQELREQVAELVEALGELFDASKGVIIDVRDGRAPLFQLQSSQRKAESLLTRAKEYLK